MVIHEIICPKIVNKIFAKRVDFLQILVTICSNF